MSGHTPMTMKSISEITLIPIGVAVISIGGGAMWLTEIYQQGRSNSNRIERLEQKQDEFNKLVIEINGRLSRIEWRLEEKSLKK